MTPETSLYASEPAAILFAITGSSDGTQLFSHYLKLAELHCYPIVTLISCSGNIKETFSEWLASAAISVEDS